MKKKFVPNKPIKKVHWCAITPQKISPKSFWAICQEEKLASDDIFAGLADKFPQREAKVGLQTSFSLKKDIDLRIIDRKCAQNLLILLNSSLKKYSAEQIKQSILRCNTSILNSDVIQQLIRCLPLPDQIIRLYEIQSGGDKLSESEEFIAVLGSIENVVPRLKSLNFKLCIEDMIQTVEQNVLSGIEACKQIISSQKLAKVLELILLFGNYMNSDSVNGQAYGFELSILTKLKDTKDSNNKQTLLHYLVETIERKFPEVLTFGEEIHHSKKASRIQIVNIQEIMLEMDASLEDLKLTLQSSKESQSSDDIFTNVMVDFSVKSFGRVVDLKALILKMETCYKEVADYFAFDPKKYSIETLFSDIETFKGSFEQVYNQILTARKTQDRNEKMSNTRTARKMSSHKLKSVDKKRSTLVRNDEAQLRSQFGLKVNKSVIRKFCRGMEIKLDKLGVTGM